MTESVQAKKPRKLDGLQAGRAFAAWGVALFHANIFVVPDVYGLNQEAARVFGIGRAGVEFFFVLSGFILYFIHKKDFDLPASLPRYTKRRLLRIYPIYWIILFTLYAAYAVAPSLGNHGNARDGLYLLLSPLLVPTPGKPVLPVAWTLQHEMFFYVVFGLLIWRFRLGVAAFVVWMAACLAFPPTTQTAFPLSFFLSPLNLLFLIGIGSAAVVDKVGEKTSALLFVAGVAIFLCTGYGEVSGWFVGQPNGLLQTMLYGVGASGAIIGLAKGVVRTPQTIVLIGDASYVFYLVHGPAISLFDKVVVRMGGPWGLHPFILIFLAIVFATCVALAIHLIIERPLLKYLNHRAARPPRPAPS